MNIIHQPHDKFFKETLSDLDTTKDFINNYLPESLLRHIDLGNIKVEKDSFIESDLKESSADLLFRTTISGQPGYVYFLFEHKSYASPMISVQLLKYMCRIWESKQAKEKQYPLPVILPIVFYHGERSWNVSPQMADMLEEHVPKEFNDYIPDYRYILYDLSHFSEEDIRGSVKLYIFMEIMRIIYRSEEEFLAGLQRITELMGDMRSRRTWMGYFETCVRYIMNARENITLTEIYDIAKSVSIEGGETIMTIAEQLLKEGIEKGIERGIEEGIERGIEEGIERGIEKGRQEGKINILIKQLTKKLGELPSQIESQLYKASPDIIDRLAEDIFEIENLDDVEKLLR